MAIPLKQGLKLSSSITSLNRFNVDMAIPLKQGLKQKMVMVLTSSRTELIWQFH